MYTSFYGFSEKPFNVTPDPRFFYQTPSHRESLASMIYGIKERKGFISITGEVGTGKTTLIYTLLQHLGEKTNTVFIFHTNITFEQLLENILLELGVPVVEKGKTLLLRLLNEYLILRLSRDETLVVIIDEAQNLSKEILEELRMLSNLETPDSKLLQIILVGQPELDAKLNSEDLRQLKQRIGIRRQLRTLTHEQCKEYINHRLNLVGSSSSRIFTTEAISLICDSAEGIPRNINVLCDNALLIGYSLSRNKIDANIIHEVIRDMDSSIWEKPTHPEAAPVNISQPLASTTSFLYNKVSFFAISLLCLVLLLFLGKQYFQKNRQTPRQTQTPVRSVPITTEDVKTSKNILGEATSSPSKGKAKIKQTVAAKKNDCMLSLGQKYYHKMNETLLDLMLESNPEITNIHLISVNQEIKIPEIAEESLINQSPDHSYKIHLGTFLTPGATKIYDREPALKGKELEIVPRIVSPVDTWYRILVGKYDNKKECLNMISILKEKGLLPIFEGVEKKFGS